MPKWASEAVRAAAAELVRTNATHLHVCVGQPNSYADALTRSRASVALSPTDMAVIASGEQRLVRFSGKAGVEATGNGTVDHVAVVDAVAADLILVTTIAATAVYTAGLLNINGFDAAIIGQPV